MRADRQGDAALQQARAKHKELEAKNPTNYVGSGPYRHDFPDGDGLKVACLPAVLATVFLFALSGPGFLMVWFAPKVWLLKELASLVR
jgi:hypothetical protein